MPVSAPARRAPRVHPVTTLAYVVADDGGWLPGLYTSPEVAEAAARLPVDVLQRLAATRAIIRADDLPARP